MNTQNERQNEQFVILVLIGALALNYPLLSLFADGGLLFGIPILYLYLFVLWAGFIALAALVIEARNRKEHQGTSPQATKANDLNIKG